MVHGLFLTSDLLLHRSEYRPRPYACEAELDVGVVCENDTVDVVTCNHVSAARMR